MTGKDKNQRAGKEEKICPEEMEPAPRARVRKQEAAGDAASPRANPHRCRRRAVGEADRADEMAAAAAAMPEKNPDRAAATAK